MVNIGFLHEILGCLPNIRALSFFLGGTAVSGECRAI